MKSYESYKNANEKWYNSYPSHWSQKRVKEIFSQRKEKNNPIITTNVLSLSAKSGVLPVSEKTDKGGNKPKEDLSKYSIARENDLLVNCMNIVSGAAGVSKWFGAISPVYYALYLRDESMNIVFYHYLFRLTNFQKSLLGLGKGILMIESSSGKLNTVRMRIPMSSLGNIVLPTPPIEEQNKIVKYLDWQTSKINKLINAKKRQIALLTEQKQAIINKVVTKGLDENAPMKDSYIFWLNQIPHNWSSKRMKNICEINASISSYKDTYCDNDEIVFLAMENISKNGVIDCSIKKKYKDVKTGYSSFIKNDVVIAKITPCFENGKGACLDKLETDIGFGTTELITIRPNTNVDSKYLYYITMTSYFRKFGADIMTGSAGQKRISSEYVSNFQIGVPDIKTQKELVKNIECRFDIIDKMMLNINLELLRFQEYKTSLISSVVTGQIDVRDIIVPEFNIEDEQTEESDKEDLFDDELDVAEEE